MHLMLSLVGGHGIALLGSRFVLGLLHRIEHAPGRRLLQLEALALPLSSLLVLVMGIRHLFVSRCLLDGSWSWWSHLLALLLVLAMGGIVLGAILLGLCRHLVMIIAMKQQPATVDPHLETRVKQLASALHLPQFQVRVMPLMRPLALLYGIKHPTMLISTWLLTHLDQEELEAVLTHVLVHVLRCDYLVNWAAMILRDAFFYLPTSRYAYRQSLYERELACDDRVVQITGRPLALASALAKVGLHQRGVSLLPSTRTLTSRDERLTSRIRRLLTITSAQSACASLSPHIREGHFVIWIPLLVVTTNVALALILALY
ncbi:MAG: M56 family metallopeptidase [Ktedonobacteraceae bacterium]|nr:M56 family metallopeptidase [Ktedonobacteraceae bacterium]